jgi:hypothetical protein
VCKKTFVFPSYFLHPANTDLARVSQTDFLIPILKQSHSGAVQKCSDARRARNRTARRIFTYVERCGLQRNTADERFSTALFPVIF